MKIISEFYSDDFVKKSVIVKDERPTNGEPYKVSLFKDDVLLSQIDFKNLDVAIWYAEDWTAL